MKKTLILLSCLLIFNFTNAEEEIPHYKIYPKTPVVDYQEDILDFYSTKSLYGEFSNFALFPIELDGKTWPSSEHYYQAHKYINEEHIEWVRLASSPYEAAKRGRDISIPKREDWIEVKDQIMEKAVSQKFQTYLVLQELLLSTKNSKIFEHTSNDCYWGDCYDRSGQNKLGKLLMKIRQELSSNNRH